jgi:uncharacterized membrane protein
MEEKTRNPIKRLSNWHNNLNMFEKVGFYLALLVGVFVISLVIALLVAIFGDSGSVANTIAIIRDLFLILLAMQGMVITLALVVLILQIATLINLLQNEVSPIVNNLQDASQTLKGTSEFLKENATAPVIEASAWLSGVTAFVRELGGIRKAVKKNGKQPDNE